MAGLTSLALIGKGDYVIRRIQLILAVAAAMTMLMVVTNPAMADENDRECFPFCDNHHDNDRNDIDEDELFIDEFDELDIGDFVVEAELDDCEIVGWDDWGEAIVVCELDVDF
jgi:hypothetical protein